MKKARVPFGEALRQLLDDRGISLRQLETATKASDPEGRGLTNSFLSQAASGRAKITPAAIRKVALALQIDPCYFIEYRGWAVRSQFDPSAVSIEQLAANLDDLNAVFGLAGAAERKLHAALIDCITPDEFEPSPGQAGAGLRRLGDRLADQASEAAGEPVEADKRPSA